MCTLLNAVCTPYKRKYKIVGVKNQTSSNTLTLEDLNCIFFFCSVVSFACFHLTGSREIAYTFHVTDDACKVIYIRRVAVWALFQVALVDVSALVAHRVRYVECEVVAPFFGSHAHELSVLCLRQVLVKVHVQCRTARKVFYVGRAVQAELVENGERIVFYAIEIAVVAVARYEISVGFVPLCMLHTYVFGRYHLAVEHGFLRAILLVVGLYES